MQRELLIQLITAAFPEEYSPQIQSELTADTPHPEEQEAARLFIGRRWVEIEDSTLLQHFPAPFLIRARAFQYYLPAFLITALRNPDAMLMDTLINFFLVPPKKPESFAAFATQYADLSPNQKHAVKTFLLFAKDMLYKKALSSLEGTESESCVRLARRIDDAIERFWEPKT